MGSKAKRTTVGFRYYMGIHMGLGRGPVDEICEIRVGDRTAWEGSVTGNSSVEINKPDLFGGEKGEGGIQGTLQVLMGGQTQVATDELREMLGDDSVPGFRGVVSTFFNGMICAMNPYPKAWKYRVRRILQGWQNGPWYSGKALVVMAGQSADYGSRDIHAMNPAHIVYECLTNSAWGRGLDPADLNTESFRAAADYLYDEGFGLCIRWARTETIDRFIQTVIDHIAGVLYQDRFTGLYTLKLLRFDYNPETLPTYGTYNGLLQISEISNASPAQLVSEVIVNWHNPIDNNDSQVRAQNLAGQRSIGGSITVERTYKGIPTAELAHRLAQRDLKVASTNLRRFRATADRRLWKLTPGDVIRINEPSRGVGQLIVRIATVDEAGTGDGQITFTAVQDMFSFTLSAFTGVQPPTHQLPDFVPQARRQLVYEKPYVEFAREYPLGEFQALPNTACVYSHHMDRATLLCQGFESTVQLVADPDYFDFDNWGDFTAISLTTATLEYLTEVMPYSFDQQLEEVTFPTYALIEDEFIQVLSVNETAKTMQVRRGVLDTVPARHLAGNTVWFVALDGTSNYINYAPGEQLVIRGIPFTLRGGSVDDDLAPTSFLTMNYRFFRPYPPGAVFVESLSTAKTNWFNPVELRHDVGGYEIPDPENPEGPPIYIEVPDFLTLSWAHRDRLMQNDQLIDHTQASIGPEPGTQYRIEVKNGEGVTVRTSTVSGTEYVYTYGMAETDLELSSQATDPVPAIVTLFALRDGLTSWQGYTIFLNVYQRPESSLQLRSTMQFQQVSSEEQMDAAGSGAIATLAYSTVSADEPMQDITGVYVTRETNGVTHQDSYPALFSSVCFETPYVMRLRDGRVPTDSGIAVLVSGPEDKIVDQYNLKDRIVDQSNPEAPYTDHGLYSFSPWVDVETGAGFFGTTFSVAYEMVRRQVGTTPAGKPIYQWFRDATKPLTSERVGAPTPVVVEPGTMGIIGDEVVEIVSISRNTYGVATVEVRRGCADTIPKNNPGRRLWFIDANTARSNRIFPAGTVAQYVLDPFIDGPKPTLAEMSSGFLSIYERGRRPYPPGLMLANGEHWFNARTAYPRSGQLELSWAYRNRMVQGTDLFDHFDVGIPPENGVEYILTVTGYNGQEIRRFKTGGSGITLTEEAVVDACKAYYATVPPPSSPTGGTLPKPSWPGHGPIPMRLFSALGAYPSWQGYIFSIYYGTPPPEEGDSDDGGSEGGSGGGSGGGGNGGSGGTGGGSGGGSGGGNSGGGSTNPPVDPPDPIDPGTEPEFPGTDQPPVDPVDPPVDPTDVSGWGENWSNGWNGEPVED